WRIWARWVGRWGRLAAEPRRSPVAARGLVAGIEYRKLGLGRGGEVAVCAASAYTEAGAERNSYAARCDANGEFNAEPGPGHDHPSRDADASGAPGICCSCTSRGLREDDRLAG
ncbi:MAG TPA: hypothetical protein VJK02_23065, partial [Anaerolineales bacterium]|nr:hypothetical protein [Anaerolineales bacterium]